MTNDDIRRLTLQLAVTGVTQKVHAIEAELAIYHKQWPELFLSRQPPRLLKAESNGHRPEAPGKWSLWTPERRARHARAIRRAWRAKKAAARTRPPMSKAARRKLSLSMKRRHASGEMAKARARAAKKRASANA